MSGLYGRPVTRPDSQGRTVVALLLAGVFLAALMAGAHPGRADATSACVGKLLQAPTKGKYFKIERPGRKANDAGSGGQEMLLFLKFGAVPHCESYGRTVQMKEEIKRAGRPWRSPAEGKYWANATTGLKGTTGAMEPGELMPALTEYMATCEGGRRPRFRVAVRVQVKLVRTRKVVATSPVTHLRVAYKPTSASHC